jgi:Domain of unknown function (DUF4381)
MKRFPLLLSSVLFLPAITLASGEEDAPLVLQQSPSTATTTVGAELRDIHGPLPLPNDLPLAAIAAALVLGLIALLLLYRLWKQRRQGKQLPPVAPWEEALQALSEARRLLQEGHNLAYLERTADILRRYVEQRFALPSTRQTTREFLAGLGTQGAASLHTYHHDLQAVLERADLAKFAHHSAGLDQLEEVESSLRRFIERTIPVAPSGDKP